VKCNDRQRSDDDTPSVTIKRDEQLAAVMNSSVQLAVESAKALDSAFQSAVAAGQQLEKVEALVKRATLPESAVADLHVSYDIEDLTPKIERPRSYFASGRDSRGVADYIRSRRPQVIVLMGAGASTSAGIPDFRTPGIGLYDVLERKGLANPRLAFDLEHFRKDPDHLYSVAREIWPRPERKPTVVHQFLRFLHDEGMLLRCYTQNIDGLERAAGIPDDSLVEAHGNFRCAQGIDTGRSIPAEEVREAVFNGTGAEELRSKYGELVKPGIMLYGDKLPKRFGRSVAVDFPKCELLIVIGTSLRVAPFCQLVRQVPTTCPRLLMNQTAVGLSTDLIGGFCFDPENRNSRDVMIKGACDDSARQLCSHLGWEDRLK